MRPNKLIAATIAAGLSIGLALSSPTANAEESNETVTTGQHGFFVPGRGGSDDPQNYVHPELPFPMHYVDNGFGFSTLDVSVAAGVANLVESIKANATPYEEFGDFVHLTCYGVGCIVVHKTKLSFEDGGELDDYVLYEVTSFRDPSNADGGILTKLPFDLPGFSRVNQDDYTDATYEQTVTYRYDPASDAQDRPGLLAFANAFAAGLYYGNDYGYQQLTDAIADGRVVTTVTTNENGSTRVHMLVDDPDRGLPLTKLFRDIGLALNDDAGDVKVHEFWDGIDNILRSHIDSKYDTGPNPEVNQREVSTINGVPSTPPDDNVDEDNQDEDTVEQTSFSQPDDNQNVNRSSAVADTGTPPANNDSADSNAAPPNEPAAEPVKKTWKQRMADKKAERQAEREAKKAEREAPREEQEQDVKDTIDSVTDAPSPNEGDNPSNVDNDDNKDGSDNDNDNGDGGES